VIGDTPLAWGADFDGKAKTQLRRAYVAAASFGMRYGRLGLAEACVGGLGAHKMLTSIGRIAPGLGQVRYWIRNESGIDHW
jgi:hypothetical protein